MNLNLKQMNPMRLFVKGLYKIKSDLIQKILKKKNSGTEKNIKKIRRYLILFIEKTF